MFHFCQLLPLKSYLWNVLKLLAKMGALTTEPRSLGVQISTCHRRSQKLVYYHLSQDSTSAKLSTGMKAVSRATKTQGKPNHWLSQLETKPFTVVFFGMHTVGQISVFGMHTVGHIMAHSESPWKGLPQRNRHTPAGRWCHWQSQPIQRQGFRNGNYRQPCNSLCQTNSADAKCTPVMPQGLKSS